MTQVNYFQSHTPDQNQNNSNHINESLATKSQSQSGFSGPTNPTQHSGLSYNGRSVTNSEGAQVTTQSQYNNNFGPGTSASTNASSPSGPQQPNNQTSLSTPLTWSQMVPCELSRSGFQQWWTLHCGRCYRRYRRCRTRTKLKLFYTDEQKEERRDKIVTRRVHKRLWDAV